MASETIKQIAASIAAELREHPETWIKGTNARDSEGSRCSPVDPSAVCWCLWGHIRKRSPGDITHQEIIDGFDFESVSDLQEFNDHRLINIADIVDRCEAVANG